MKKTQDEKPFIEFLDELIIEMCAAWSCIENVVDEHPEKPAHWRDIARNVHDGAVRLRDMFFALDDWSHDLPPAMTEREVQRWNEAVYNLVDIAGKYRREPSLLETYRPMIAQLPLIDLSQG
jgi:hypothetical protein